MKNLFDKYTVTKKVGETDPNAKYFVLRIDKDRHARVALAAYIKSIQQEEPEFARQLTEWLCLIDHRPNNPRMANIYLLDATDDQLKALAYGLLIQERPFTVREWCGAGKPFSVMQLIDLRDAMLSQEMLSWASEKDARRGVVLTHFGREVLTIIIFSSV